jgi:hypothetical protein
MDEDNDAGRWMTFTELSEARGISRAGMRHGAVLERRAEPTRRSVTARDTAQPGRSVRLPIAQNHSEPRRSSAFPAAA